MDNELLKEGIEHNIADATVGRDQQQTTSQSIPQRFHGRRVEVEFWCAECEHYLYIKLNTSLDGNHMVICPNCQHEHYRVVQAGIITSDRYYEGKAIADQIIPMKSAAVPAAERRQRGSISVIREMEAVGLLK